MLVLKRDRATGDVVMLMELDNDPPPAWTPGPTPTPNWHREPPLVTAGPDDVEWFKDAVVRYVAEHEWAPFDEVEDVDWRRLCRDLEIYAWSTAMEAGQQ